MTHSIPDYIKLHTEETPVLPGLETAAGDELTRLSSAFLEATGWSLHYQQQEGPQQENARNLQSPATDELAVSVPVLDQAQQLLGEFLLEQAPTTSQEIPEMALPAATELATAISGLVSTLEQARETVWKQEAQLAASIPVSVRKDEETHLAARLESILRCGAEAIGCQAAAAYLLDDDTRYLKLRSCWGLPSQRLLDPPRPLQGASVDLEALVGHAVVLKDASCMPESLSEHTFPSAICVPISSPTVPLGTLWIFSDADRTFNQQESNLVEMVAGRISAELEREVLLQQAITASLQERQWQHAMTWQENRLPRNPPLLTGWQIAAGTEQAQQIGGDFHDWTILTDNRLAVMVGDAAGSTIESALTTATVQASMRAHMDAMPRPGDLLNHVNHLLWTGCTGDQFASLFYAVIDESTGRLEYSGVGDVAGILLREDSFRWLHANPLALGTQESSEYETVVEQIQVGDTFVLFSEGLIAGHQQHDPREIEESLITLLRQLENATAHEIVQVMKQWGATPERDLSEEDQTVLVIRRTG